MKKIIISWFMVILILMGCSKDTGDKSPDYNETGTLNLYWYSNIGTDRIFECPWLGEQSLYPEMLFNTLVQNNGSATEILPELALDWVISDDGMVYTFTITDKALWHDGTPLTVDDIYFTYNAILKVANSSQKAMFMALKGAQDVIDGKAESVSGITVHGNTISFKILHRNNSVESELFARIRILPKHLLENVDPVSLASDKAYWSYPIGSGLYRIDEVSFPDSFTLVRNDDYFSDKAQIRHVKFTNPGPSSMSDVIAGHIDYVFGNDTNDINAAINIIANNPDIKMRLFPGGYLRKMAFNLAGSSQDGKYNDDVMKKEVRQALNLLIDKEAMAALYPGQGVPMTTMVNTKMSAYNTDIPLFKRDVKKAKSMLDAAGFNFSRPLRILYYYKDQTTKDLMDILIQDFADAGVIAEPFLAEGDLSSIIYDLRNYDIIYLGGGGPKPIHNYSILRISGRDNNVLQVDAVHRQIYAELLDNYSATNDPGEKKRIGDEIQLKAQDFSAILAIYGLNEIVLYNAEKLKLPDDLFDAVPRNNYQLSKWELIGE